MLFFPLGMPCPFLSFFYVPAQPCSSLSHKRGNKDTQSCSSFQCHLKEEKSFYILQRWPLLPSLAPIAPWTCVRISITFVTTYWVFLFLMACTACCYYDLQVSRDNGSTWAPGASHPSCFPATSPDGCPCFPAPWLPGILGPSSLLLHTPHLIAFASLCPQQGFGYGCRKGTGWACGLHGILEPRMLWH